MFRIINTVLRNVTKNNFIAKEIHSSSFNLKNDERIWTYRTLPKLDEGTEGESVVDIDYLIDGKKSESIFPTKTSNLRTFNGVPYEQIPIVNIRVTKNNTIINVTSPDGETALIRSCGLEGFKNARKGTNVAAQATAITLSTKAIERGFKDVRVRVRGLGPGRMASLKGLQMGGLNIISVTDNTRVSWNPPRPRKARRL